MENRNAFLEHKASDGTYVVRLMENNNTVHTQIHENFKAANEAKDSWLSGGGPQFLTD